MKLPFEDRLSLPAVAAPMFLISGPQLVIECCKNGVVGTFPALNQRSTEGFEEWVIEIKEALTAFEKETGQTDRSPGANIRIVPLPSFRHENYLSSSPKNRSITT